MSATLWAVDVTTSPTFQFGRPRQLRTGPATIRGAGFDFRTFDPIPGTDSFVAVVVPEGQTVVPVGDERRIHVILNWRDALRARPAVAQ
jgi:hypothetical protein